MRPPIFLSASEPDPNRAPEYWNSRRLLNVRAAVRAFCAHALPHFPVVFGGHPAITPLVRNVADHVAFDERPEEEEPEERPHGGGTLPCVLMYQSAQFVAHDSAEGEASGEERGLVEEIRTPALDAGGNEMPAKKGARRESLLYMRYQMIGKPIDAAFRNALRVEERDRRLLWLLERYGSTLGTKRLDRFKTHAFSAAVFIGGMEGVEREFNIFRTFHPHAPAFPIASTGSACEKLLPLAGRHLMRQDLVRSLHDEAAYNLLMQQLFPVGRDPGEIGWRVEQEPLPFSLADHADPENLVPRSN
jgi:hypothetical protein